MRGQKVSGDQYTVQVSGARIVLAVIDGLGHGPEAAAAAEQAVAVVDRHPAEPLDVLMLLVHRELADSRGAAATIAIVEGESGTLNWIGVGNVDGVLLRADSDARPRMHGVFLVGGVLGYHMQRLHLPQPVALEDGDLIVMATDGVGADLTAVVRADLTVERLAEMIITKHARQNDDSLVLVARYQTIHQPTEETEQSIYRPLHPSADTTTVEPVYRPLGPSSTR